MSVDLVDKKHQHASESQMLSRPLSFYSVKTVNLPLLIKLEARNKARNLWHVISALSAISLAILEIAVFQYLLE